MTEKIAGEGVKLGREWLIRSPVIASICIVCLGEGWLQYRSYMEIQEQNKAMFASLQELHTKTNGQLVELTRDTVKSNAELKAAVESMKDLIRAQRITADRPTRGDL